MSKRFLDDPTTQPTSSIMLTVPMPEDLSQDGINHSRGNSILISFWNLPSRRNMKICTLRCQRNRLNSHPRIHSGTTMIIYARKNSASKTWRVISLTPPTRVDKHPKSTRRKTISIISNARIRTCLASSDPHWESWGQWLARDRKGRILLQISQQARRLVDRGS